MGEDRLLTAEEAGRLLRVTSATVREWVKVGRISPVKSAGRKLLFRREDLLDATPEAVGSADLQKLRTALKKARKCAAAAEAKVAEARAERDRIDARRDVLTVQLEGLQVEKVGVDGEPRQKVVVRIAKLGAELTELEESGLGLGGTFAEFQDLTLALLRTDIGAESAEVEMRRDRLGRWLAGLREGERGIGALLALTDGVTAAVETVRLALVPLAEAEAANVERRVVDLARQAAEAHAELSTLQGAAQASGPAALAAADELLEGGTK